MADKYLNNTGLQYFYNRIKTIFASKSELPTKTSDLTNDSNFITSNDLPTKTSDLTNDGDGTSNFATEDYVDQNGGKIDVIKVNGTAQTITNKEVDLTVPVNMSDLSNDNNYINFDIGSVPTSITLTADGSYSLTFSNNNNNLSVSYNDENGDTWAFNLITKAVNDLVNYYTKSDTYTKTEVNNLIGGISTVNFLIVQTLPTTDISTSTIYLVPKSTSQTQNVYDEYVYINNAWELIGTTNIDLSNYWSMTDLVAITTAEIDAIVV